MAEINFDTSGDIPLGSVIIIKLTGYNAAFTAIPGAVTLTNPAIYSADTDFIGSSAKIVSVSQSNLETTIKIKLGDDTGAPGVGSGTCEGIILRLTGIVNPTTLTTTTSRHRVFVTLDETQAETSDNTEKMTTEPVTFSKSMLSLYPTEYQTETIVTFTFTLSNHDIVVGDTLYLQLPKFTGKPKTLSKCAQSPRSVLDGGTEPVMWRVTVNSSSTDGNDLYRCDANQDYCELHLTAVNNGLARDTQCTINITGLTTPAITLMQNDAFVCNLASCSDIYKYKYTTRAIPMSTVANIDTWTTIGETGGSVISGPGKMSFMEMSFSSYTSDRATDIYFSFIYNQLLTGGQETIKLYFKEHGDYRAVVATTTTANPVVESLDGTCGDATFSVLLNLEGFNVVNMEISIGDNTYVPAGTLCKLKINSGNTDDLKTVDGVVPAPVSTSDDYGVEIATTASGENAITAMAKIPIYPFPAISYGIFVESSLKFEGVTGNKIDIYYTFMYNEEIPENGKIKVNIKGTESSTSSSRLTSNHLGSFCERVTLLDTMQTLPAFELKIDDGPLPPSSLCTIKIMGGSLASDTINVEANSISHTQQVEDENGNDKTPVIPIAKSDPIWVTIAPKLYVVKKDCKYFNSAADCDHGKLSTVENILVNSITQSAEVRSTGGNIYHQELTTATNGRGSGAILNLWSSDSESLDTDLMSPSSGKISVTAPGNGYKVGDLLIVPADQLPGSSTDLVFTLQGEDIVNPDHCQSCSGKTAFGYSMKITHGTSCISSSQTSCDPLFKTFSSVDLYVDPSGYEGDIFCGVYKATSSAPSASLPTSLIHETSLDGGPLDESLNGLLPSLSQQINYIDVTTSGKLKNGIDFYADVIVNKVEARKGVSGDSADLTHSSDCSKTFGSGTNWTLSFNDDDSLKEVISTSPGYGYRPGDKICITKDSSILTLDIKILLQKYHFQDEGYHGLTTISSGVGAGATINLIAGGALTGGGTSNVDLAAATAKLTGLSGSAALNPVTHLPGIGFRGLGGTKGTGATFKIHKNVGDTIIEGITVVTGGSGYQIGDILVISKESINSNHDLVLRVEPEHIAISSGKITGATITKGVAGTNYCVGDTLEVDFSSVGDNITYGGKVEFTLREDDIEKESLLISRNKVTIPNNGRQEDVVIHIESLTSNTMYNAYCHFGNVILPELDENTVASITNFWTDSNPNIWGDSIRVSSHTEYADPGKLTLTFTHGSRIPGYGEIKLVPSETLFKAETKCSIEDQMGGNTAVITTFLGSNYEYVKFQLSSHGSTVTSSSGKQFIIVCTDLDINKAKNTVVTYGLAATDHNLLRARVGYTTTK
eukprot:g3786.t1